MSKAKILERKDPTSPHIMQYNHVHPDFSQEVNEHFNKLDILKYYPYSSNTNWEYWLCGNVDLKKEYLHKRNKHLTEWDYVFLIIEETARAMNYLMVHGNDHWFDRQRLDAFALWRLFHSGDCGWSKKNLKGLTLEQKTKLFWKGQRDAEELYGFDKKDIRLTVPKNKESGNLADDWFNHSLKKYGVYEVRHKPLIQYSNTVRGKRPKVLYTKQQLAAIHLMITCYFENLC